MSPLNRDAWATTLIVAFVLAAPVVWAQSSDNTTSDQDPEVNESDFDTNPPPSDESYLNESDSTTPSDPDVNESDFDTTAPAADESYLDEDPSVGDDDFDTTVPPGDDSYLNDDKDAGASTDTTGGAKTPGPSVVLGIAILGIAALATRRLRR